MVRGPGNFAWFRGGCDEIHRIPIALSLILLLLTAGAARAQGTITIPCAHVDEFLRGAIEVPRGATVKVSAVTVSELIARVGGPENFAALMRTREGRQAVKDAGAITDEEFEWCKQRVQSELLRRQRERPVPERPPSPPARPPASADARSGTLVYLMVPPPLRESTPLGPRWSSLETFDTAAACQEALTDSLPRAGATAFVPCRGRWHGPRGRGARRTAP
jgi:hypothetical protein